MSGNYPDWENVTVTWAMKLGSSSYCGAHSNVSVTWAMKLGSSGYCGPHSNTQQEASVTATSTIIKGYSINTMEMLNSVSKQSVWKVAFGLQED
jgi:hypothetical protein